jgi:hypothetical protein
MELEEAAWQHPRCVYLLLFLVYVYYGYREEKEVSG